MFELRSHVKYFRKESGQPVGYDALVIGREHAVEGEEFPKLHLAFIGPKDLASLNGANWQDAFERAWSVPHSDASGHQWYTDEEEAESHRFLSALQQSGIRKDPSAADLDATAAETAAKEQTAAKLAKPSEPAKPVLVKGVSPKGPAK